jgi:hypothetical protein
MVAWALLCWLAYQQAVGPHVKPVPIEPGRYAALLIGPDAALLREAMPPPFKPNYVLLLVVGAVLPLSAAQVIGGWRWRLWSPNLAYTALADDELTRALRAKAMAVGYITLLLGVGIGGPLALRFPDLTLAIFLAVLWLGFAIPTLTLTWLEHRAGAND